MAGGRKRAAIRHLLRTLLNAVRRGSGRFTTAVVAIVLYTIVVNIIVAGSFDIEAPTTARMLSALYAAGVGSIAVRLFLESRAVARTALDLVPAALAVTLAIVVWVASPVMILAPSIIGALLVLVPLAPFVGRGTPRRFWDFTLWTILGAALALVAVGLFALGLFAVVALVEVLFQIGVQRRIYTHAALTAVFLVGPLIALGRIPLIERDEKLLDGRLIGFVKPVFQYVAAPFALVIALVLHVYAVRALFTDGPGDGEIGWITAFFLILMFALRLGIEPYLGQGSRLLDLVARRFALICAVPLVLLAIAAADRIAAEGVTLPRYYLVVLCVTMLLAIALQAFRQTRGDIRWLAALGPVVLVLSAIGPWGAAATVTRSQIARIATEQAVFATRQPGVNDRHRLRSRLVALDQVESLDAAAPLLPAEATMAREAVDGQEDGAVEIVLRTLQPGGANLPAVELRNLNFSVRTALALDGFDLAETAISVVSAPSTESSERVFRFEGTQLMLTPTVGVDIAPVIAGLVAGSANDGEAPVVDLVADGGRPVRLRIEWITLDIEGLPADAGVTVLVRRADFPDGLFGGR